MRNQTLRAIPTGSGSRVSDTGAESSPSTTSTLAGEGKLDPSEMDSIAKFIIFACFGQASTLPLLPCFERKKMKAGFQIFQTFDPLCDTP
jgi:hypothetical protein